MLALSVSSVSGHWFQIADLNVGLLFLLGIGSMGIYGIVLGGWASNSHYSLLGALRSSAQLVSYETAAGMAVVSGLMFGGALSTRRWWKRRRRAVCGSFFWRQSVFFSISSLRLRKRTARPLTCRKLNRN